MDSKQLPTKKGVALGPGYHETETTLSLDPPRLQGSQISAPNGLCLVVFWVAQTSASELQHLT